jgi:glucokinase
MPETENSTGNLVGVEATTSNLLAVCLHRDGQVTGTHKIAVDKQASGLSQLAGFVNDLKGRFGEFQNIGIAVPGLIHRERKRVAFSTHIPEHAEVDFASEIESSTGLKTTIENDANAAAYGEFKLGAGRDSRNIFYATLGTGVGGAFIIDGKIWYGAGGFAGEFGHVTINSDGMKLEEVASTANIVRRTRNRFHQDSTSSLGKLDERSIKISDIVTAAGRDDDFAQLMLERTGNYVGVAIANVINLLNIERIVIGGEIMQAKQLVLDAIVDRAKELSFGPSFDSTQIVEGELGENAAAVGVALLANQ